MKEDNMIKLELECDVTIDLDGFEGMCAMLNFTTYIVDISNLTFYKNMYCSIDGNDCNISSVSFLNGYAIIEIDWS